MIANKPLEILYKVDTIKFLCANAYSNNRSASLVGVTANFLYTMLHGSDFSCNIDFGDNTGMSFSSTLNYDWNNKYFPHTYVNEGKYINKKNFICM